MQCPPTSPGRKGRKFHLVPGIDSQLVENNGQFVHQRDIQVALGVFDHLGGFGHLDAGCAVHAGRDNGFIECSDFFQGIGVVARDDFQNLA